MKFPYMYEFGETRLTGTGFLVIVKTMEADLHGPEALDLIYLDTSGQQFPGNFSAYIPFYSFHRLLLGIGKTTLVVVEFQVLRHERIHYGNIAAVVGAEEQAVKHNNVIMKRFRDLHLVFGKRWLSKTYK
jgi:hypothetical protein